MAKEGLIENITRTLMGILPKLKGIVKRMHQDKMPQELRPVQVMILSTLQERGALSMGELSNTIAIAKANTTPLVADLIEKGLVQRTKDTADKRIVLIEMTKEGKRLHKELFENSRIYLKAMLDNLGEEDLGRLDEALLTIKEIVDRVPQQKE
ncbi:MarR family transcriptional regulator [Eubacteriales bacterium OttesenSCG-928-M02]|nr:MarR family transcriptional regulator [Eubacteriales bacterium OttesenSCG-928-M02]